MVDDADKPFSAEMLRQTPPTSDGDSFRKRFIVKLLNAPSVLVPSIVGMSSLFGAWAMDFRSGALCFVAAAGLLGAAGILFTRLATGGSIIGKEVVAEIEEEARQHRIDMLNRLEDELEADGDPRTESSLKDLRGLMDAFTERAAWPAGLSSRVETDIMQGVSALFERCVHSLATSVELWHLANRMTSDTTRAPILQRRETILQEVEKSVQQLSSILMGVQALATGDAIDAGELARLRAELDQNLEVARIAEKRISTLSDELDLNRT